MAAEDSGDTRLVAGRYELRKKLGRGGMGIVWQAWDTELGREVAIKEVLVPETLDPEEREEAHTRVRREARSAARLSDDPGVVTVYDVLDAEGHPWVVMRLVEGQSLQEAIRADGPLPTAQVARMAEVLVRALRSAHAKGVVHRDVKPANVMLAEDGSVLLTDFGIATVEGETAVTRTGTLVGSPEFIAPERLEDTVVSAPPSDLWSLGATLYAAVEGRTPFQRDTIAATLAAVVSRPVPPPSRVDVLSPVIMGLLERDPQRRLTADQVLGMLQSVTVPMGSNALGGLPSSTEATAAITQRPGLEPDGPSTGKALSNRRTMIVAGGLAVLLVAGGVAWYAFASQPETIDYSLHSQEDYSVEYPADWEVEEVEDSSSTTISHPDETLGLGMSASAYPPGDRFDADEDRPGARAELRRSMGPGDDDAEYSQTLLDLSDFGTWPEEWDAAVVEESATVDPEWMEEENPDWVDPERFAVRLQIHAPDRSRAYQLTWRGPQSERDRYDQIIRDTMESFRPNL